MRVLPTKRISRDTEDSSAMERQDAELREAIATGGHTVAGWVEDATVSGAVNLDERPSLGKYLAEPLVHDWDALMVTTQDRISRDDMHWWAFVGWVLANKKTIIVLDDPSFNISTEDGRMIAGIKATQAAKYRKVVQEKKLKQVEYYRQQDLWPGGTWPFGYRARKVPIGGTRRWKLFLDPVTSELVREAYDRLVNKLHTLGQIVTDWNNRGVLPPINYQRHVNALEGRESTAKALKDTLWTSGTLAAILRRPTLRGYAIDKGEIRRRDGLPVSWAEPILTQVEFDRLQAVLTERGKFRAGIRGNRTPLTGVLYCRCSAALHSSGSAHDTVTGGKIIYLRCKTAVTHNRCGFTVSWRKDFLHSAVEEDFLRLLGDVEVTTRKFVPGLDRASEIQDLKDALDNLTQAISTAKSAPVIEALGRTMEQHAANLERLEAEPVIPSRWDETGTGQTYSQVWESYDWNERGDLLRKSGIRMLVGGKPSAPDLNLYIPSDLVRRAQDVVSGTIEPTFQADWDDWIAQTARADVDASKRI